MKLTILHFLMNQHWSCVFVFNASYIDDDEVEEDEEDGVEEPAKSTRKRKTQANQEGTSEENTIRQATRKEGSKTGEAKEHAKAPIADKVANIQ